jgi:predicted aspartyl protease
MRKYKAQKRGGLLSIKVFIEGPKGRAYPTLLIDTGSAYTIIAKEILESIGCSPAIPKRTQRIITGSGYEIVPVISVERLHFWGNFLENIELLAHTLPMGTYVDGLLGMDLLNKYDIEIKLKSGEIWIR